MGLNAKIQKFFQSKSRSEQSNLELLENLLKRVSNLEYSSNLYKIDDLLQFEKLLNLLNPLEIKYGFKRRVGGQHDGGYVLWGADRYVPKNKLAICIGIGDEFTFEQELLGEGYVVYGIDGSVENVLPDTKNFHFDKLFIGDGKNSTDHLWTSFLDFYNARFASSQFESWEILKIDAEGHEYDILLDSKDLISNFNQVIIEFHGLELIFDHVFRDRFFEVLQFILNSHRPIHAHGNNSGRCIRFPHGDFPSILEVTFLKKEFCKDIHADYLYDAQMDFPNMSSRPDIDLAPFFSQNRSYLGILRKYL